MKAASSIALITLLIVGCESPPWQTTSEPHTPKLRTWPQTHSEGPVRVAMFDLTPRAESKECRIFQPGDKVPEHQVIALMTSGGHASNEAEFIGRMITHAKRLGANGFILLPYESPNSTIALAHPLWQNPGERVFRANAVILTEAK